MCKLFCFPGAMFLACFVSIQVSSILAFSRNSISFDVRSQNSYGSAIFSSNAGNVDRPKNEFSRTYDSETICYRRKSDYEASIEATDEELELLAQRFKLPSIKSLKADFGMKLQDKDNVRVRGNMYGVVTQKCVRTNEDFDNEFKHDFFTVMRPVGNSMIETAVEQIPFEAKRSSRKKKQIRTNRNQNLDETDLKELQNLMEDFDIEDDIIEDESVYEGGVIDVGELVAQIFRVKLDPFPKKPGSEPMTMEFTL